jgi:hypothetical protein
MAITPDAEEFLHGAVPEMLSTDRCLGSEPVKAWARSIYTGAVPFLRCEGLDASGKGELAVKVCRLYEQTYGVLPGAHDPVNGVPRTVAGIPRDPSQPAREYIRQIIERLDALRYRPGRHP